MEPPKTKSFVIYIYGWANSDCQIRSCLASQFGLAACPGEPGTDLGFA